ncbi:AAA family ATPase [Peribacillus butanolivorans]|uniref:AAA family ATPase n=1 Tax=Peribacillus butanolivorans TaxID=421767 RepID=UPI00366619C3
MSDQRIKELLLQQQSNVLEFKKELKSTESVAKIITAFANTYGGVLIVGHDGNNGLTGVSDVFKTKDLIMKASKLVTPMVEVKIYDREIEGKQLVIVEVPKNDNGPYIYRETRFKRNGDSILAVKTEKNLRLRVVSINELQLMTCLKHSLWGSNTSNLKNWLIGDVLLFVVNKHITALAEVSGHLFKSDEMIWDNGTFQFRLPIRFIHILSPNIRIEIIEEVKEKLQNHWHNYGIPIRNRLLIPNESAVYLFNLVVSKPNAMQAYSNRLQGYLEDARKNQETNKQVGYKEQTNLQGLRFKKLLIRNWRQYGSVDIDFHNRLTVITGSNGTGKTTILNILSEHFGWKTSYISTPIRNNTTKNYIFSALNGELIESDKAISVGEIEYSDEQYSEIKVPPDVSYVYDLTIDNIKQIKGLYVPSHRQLYKYNLIDSISTKGREDIIKDYKRAIMNGSQGISNVKSPNHIIKEGLISFALFGYGNEIINSNIDSLESFSEFEDILKVVLPEKMGFQGISVQIPEVILNTKSGDFSIDAVSGGIASLIDLAWQIFLVNKSEDNFTVIIDEPENHLHPELQRVLLPNILNAFPNIQFVVVTHNPLVVASVEDSNIYALNYGNQNQVVSHKLDWVNKAGSSNDILRDVLGISFTLPKWVEKKIDGIIEKYINGNLSAENYYSFKNEMREIGLDEFIPEALVKLTKDDIND